jgi:hypothetical protein
VFTQILERDGIRVSPPMTPHQTQPTSAFDTAELDLPPLAEPPPAELEPGRPSWEPDDGDFN